MGRPYPAAFRPLTLGAFRKHTWEQYEAEAACSARFMGTQVEQAAHRTNLLAEFGPSSRSPPADCEVPTGAPVKARSTWRSA